MNVTIPTSNYSERIWDNWFVISFTDLATKIAKPFKPLSLLRGGMKGVGAICEFLGNITIPTYNYSIRTLMLRIKHAFLGTRKHSFHPKNKDFNNSLCTMYIYLNDDGMCREVNAPRQRRGAHQDLHKPV